MAVTVSYDESKDSPKSIKFTPDGVEVIRELVCAWVDKIQLVRELLGYWSGGIYYPPDEFDATEASSGGEHLYNVFANSIEIKRRHPDAETDEAILTVTYKTLEYTQIDGDDVLVTESLQAASEYITFDRKGLGIGTGTGRIKLDEANLEAPAGINRMIEWVYTIHHLLTIPDAYFDLAGKVNHAAVSSRALGKTFPAGTLLCGNLHTRREITWDGVNMWEVTFRFLYKNNGTLADPRGHNYYPDTKNANAAGIPFVPITNESDVAVPMQPLGNFTGIVR